MNELPYTTSIIEQVIDKIQKIEPLPEANIEFKAGVSWLKEESKKVGKELISKI